MSKKKRGLAIAAVAAIIVVGAFAFTKVEKVKAGETEQVRIKVMEEFKEEMSHITLGLKGCSPAIVRQGDPYIESGAYAIDDRDGKIQELKAEGGNKVDTSKPGTYKVSYVYKNGDVEDSITRKVKVVEKAKFVPNTTGVPVLMYHYVHTDYDEPRKLINNTINQKDLEAQLAYLQSNDYYYPSLKELRAYVDGKIVLPAKSVILTFDDGELRFLKYGSESLEKYKIPGISFFICIDGNAKIKKYHSPYVCYESHSFDMHRGGGPVGHGGRISGMTKAEIKEDLSKAADFVGSNDGFAYPYGDFTDEARAVISDNGIQCAFTTKPGKVYPGMDPTVLPRVRVKRTETLAQFVQSLQ